MDFNAAQYSATNNGLLYNNKFRFQGDLVKVNHIRDSIFNVSEPISFHCNHNL
jgi:hypothetical protein